MSESEENVGQASSSSTTSTDEDLRRSRKRKAPRREGRKHKKSKVLEHLAEQVSQIQNYLSCGAFPPRNWYSYDLQQQPPVVTNIDDPSLGQDMFQSQSITEAPAESPLEFEFNLTTNDNKKKKKMAGSTDLLGCPSGRRGELRRGASPGGG
ncbi:hypothetical protein RR48_10233 [Papilio machaon]|uniref:Uncharacterized protein n=1 Tax=Papilio machaon TaxID=76193 RepID=A0A194RGR5_PAPMA|nr:hypothetical protein RR48_10233 [Papilio machaon]